MAIVRSGLTTNTKSHDVAKALQLLSKVRYNDDLDKMHKDVNKSLRAEQDKENKRRQQEYERKIRAWTAANKKRGKKQRKTKKPLKPKMARLTISKTTLIAWMQTVDLQPKGQQRIAEARTNFNKLGASKHKSIISFINKGLRKTAQAYKSSFKFVFNIITERNYIVFLTGSAWLVHAKQLATSKKLQEVMKHMVQRLVTSFKTSPQLPFKGKAIKKDYAGGRYTKAHAALLCSLIDNPRKGSKHNITIGSGRHKSVEQVEVRGSFVIYYCYKTTDDRGERFTCFDYKRVDIGGWRD